MLDHEQALLFASDTSKRSSDGLFRMQLNTNTSRLKQVQPAQPPWMAAFQQQQQQQQLAPPAQLPSPADALGPSMPAWWQQLAAQQGQQAQPPMQQVSGSSSVISVSGRLPHVVVVATTRPSDNACCWADPW